MLTVQNQDPQVKVRRTRAALSSVMQQQMTLSQGIIPAVRGEYYSYSSVFTEDRPLYSLMKCKSNKARLISEVPNLGSEASAFFHFDGMSPRVLSITEANALGLLEDMRSKDVFGDTWFAPTNLTGEQFMKLRGNKNTEELVRTCQEVLIDRQVAIELHEELVVALMTDSGKYGMFLVDEITTFSIQIEACHILL
ncbi:MAG: hypothetical protein HZB10_00895 [Candidatus Yonathbacteria bacterium]|nr:hypothetical protein [Candidatus Yonathbacteria bacterium]